MAKISADEYFSCVGYKRSFQSKSKSRASLFGQISESNGTEIISETHLAC